MPPPQDELGGMVFEKRVMCLGGPPFFSKCRKRDARCDKSHSAAGKGRTCSSRRWQCCTGWLPRSSLLMEAVSGLHSLLCELLPGAWQLCVNCYCRSCKVKVSYCVWHVLVVYYLVVHTHRSVALCYAALLALLVGVTRRLQYSREC